MSDYRIKAGGADLPEIADTTEVLRLAAVPADDMLEVLETVWLATRAEGLIRHPYRQRDARGVEVTMAIDAAAREAGYDWRVPEGAEIALHHAVGGDFDEYVRRVDIADRQVIDTLIVAGRIAREYGGKS